jgi:ribosomal protein S18 acetylase RimI-like enzyme
MQTRALKPKSGPLLFVDSLRDGDVETVRKVFTRLSDSSRRARFLGAKPCLTDAELAELARVDASHHAVVAHVPGDPEPVAIASLVRTDRVSAEIAFAVADAYQHQGVGSLLAADLIADARAAGISEITALTGADNPAALKLLRRIATVRDVTFEGRELSIRAAIA